MSRPATTGTRRFGSIVITAVFVLLAVALYWPVLGGRVPLATDDTLEQPLYRTTAFFPDPGPHAEMSDLTGRIYPGRQYAADRLGNGTFPEWNPWLLAGAPFVANARSALFYPPHFLYSVVDVPTAWSLMFLLHLAMAGTFTALFLREIECDTLAAIGGGLVFTLSGFMTAWRGYPLGAAATWLPLVAFAVVRLKRRAGPGPVVLAAFAFAMPVFAGHPEAAAHITLVGLALAAFETFKPWTTASSSERKKFAAFFVFAGLLAVLLTAIQWLPTVEWISMTVRGLDARWGGRPIGEALAFLSRDMTSHPNAQGIAIPEGAAYVGVLPWILAPIAVFGLRGYGAFFAGVGIVAAWVAFAIGPAAGIVDAIPVLGGLQNSRLLLVVDFSLAVLTGIGLTTAARAPETGKTVWLLAPLAASLVAGQVYGLAPTGAGSSEGLIAGLAVMSAILLLVRSVRLVGPTSFLAVALVILAWDLATFSYGYMPFAERDSIFPETPAMAYLEEQSGPGERTLFVDGVGDPGLGLIHGVEMVSGDDDALYNVRAFLSGYADPGLGSLSFSSDAVIEQTARDRRLDMLNVRFVVAPAASAARMVEAAPDRFGAVFVDGGVAVLVNRRALPRAYLVPVAGIEFLVDWRDRLERVRNPAFDPETSVVLGPAPALATPLSAAAGPTSGVEIVEYTGQRIRLEVRTRIPAVLVLGQVHYPGWRATVNGRERDVVEANVILSGIGLDAGTHVVELTFESRAVRTGAAVSLAGVFLIVSLAVLGRRIGVFRKSRDGWEPESGSAIPVGVISLVALVLIGLLASGYDRPRPAPRIPNGVALDVAPSVVSAGESYALRFDGLWDAAIPIRYTRDDGPVEVMTVYLDREGEAGVTRIDVPENTPPGEYRFLQARLPGSRGWVEVEAGVTIR